MQWDETSPFSHCRHWIIQYFQFGVLYNVFFDLQKMFGLIIFITLLVSGRIWVGLLGNYISLWKVSFVLVVGMCLLFKKYVEKKP